MSSATRRWLLYIAAAMLVSVSNAAPAGAQEMALGDSRSMSGLGGRRGTFYPTWGTEVRVGAYRPVLSAGGIGAAARRLNFDNANSSFFGQHPILFSLEFNGYPWQAVGLLGFYGRAGYWRASAPGRLCTDAKGKAINCTSSTVFQSTKGSDTQAINIVPISFGAIYRFDQLRRNLNLPLVFTAKLGLDYSVWWATLGRFNAHTPSGQRALGGILGWTGAVSVGYSFGSDGQMTYGRRRDAQETYLFLEYNFINGRYLFLPEDPSKPRLNLTDPAVVVIGMALDFS